MNIAALHFIRPYWFFALIPVAFLVWRLVKNRHHRSNWHKVVDAHLLKQLLNHSTSQKTLWPFYLLALMWFICIFTLAGPSFEKVKQPVYKSKNAKVILLDLSPSMLATDIKPNRISRARYKILDLLKNYPEGRTGLVVFASEAYTVSPLTYDNNTIASMVPELSPDIMPVTGSNIAAGLKKAVSLFKNVDVSKGTIILMTDSLPNRNAFKEAKKLYGQGYTISVLAIGSTQGGTIAKPHGGFYGQNDKPIIAKVNYKALEKLATSGNGKFSSFTNSDADINYLLKNNIDHSITQAKQMKANSVIWQDSGYWLILLLLAFMLMFFRRGFLEDLFS